jgi:hypothetical protein
MKIEIDFHSPSELWSPKSSERCLVITYGMWDDGRDQVSTACYDAVLGYLFTGDQWFYKRDVIAWARSDDIAQAIKAALEKRSDKCTQCINSL